MEYFTTSRELNCYNCEKKEFGNISCTSGHYICDECHGKDIYDTIRDYIMKATSQNPFEIAEDLMSYNKVPMLGCENAWIAAGALMASLKNEGTVVLTNEHICEVLNRTRKQAIGGYCGLTGVCGIAPAIGACFSVILGVTCPNDQETVATMKIVSKIINAIADQTGPCCYKSFVRVALNEAIKSGKEHLSVSLPSPSEAIICTYSERHPHGCRKSKCPYFEMNEAPKILKMERRNIMDQSLSKFNSLVNKAIELGVEEAKIIDSSSITVAEWVLWKCQYGCPFYNKSSLHPPLAPSVEQTKKVMREYDKALLLTGSNGPQLSQQAIKVEHEAYALGFYKAFALLSLPFGDNPS